MVSIAPGLAWPPTPPVGQPAPQPNVDRSIAQSMYGLLSNPTPLVTASSRNIDSGSVVTVGRDGVSGAGTMIGDARRAIDEGKLRLNTQGRLPLGGLLQTASDMRTTMTVKGKKEPQYQMSVRSTIAARISSPNVISMMPMFTYIKGKNFSGHIEVFTWAELNLYMRRKYIDMVGRDTDLGGGLNLQMSPALPPESQMRSLMYDSAYGLYSQTVAQQEYDSANALVQAVGNAPYAAEAARSAKSRLEIATKAYKMINDDEKRIYYPSLIARDFKLAGVIYSYEETQVRIRAVAVGFMQPDIYKTLSINYESCGPIDIKNYWAGKTLKTGSRLFMILTRGRDDGVPVILPWSCDPDEVVKVPDDLAYYTDISGNEQPSIVREVAYVVEVPNEYQPVLQQSDKKTALQAVCADRNPSRESSARGIADLGYDIKVQWY